MSSPPLPAEPVRGERTAEIVARLLSQAILDGDLAPGTRLREETLASVYGVSRTPIREALILLGSSGLIGLAPNRGATVLRLTVDDIAEIYHLRGLLESEAVSLATQRATPELIGLLNRSCDRLAELHGAAAGEQLRADMHFHYGIAEASGSPRLYALIRQVSAIPEGYRSSIPYSSQDLTEAERQHRAIAGALRNGRCQEAAGLMRSHVGWAGQLAVRSLGDRLGAGLAWPDQPERPDQQARPGRSERSERPDQHVPPGRSEPPDQHVPPDQPERSERPDQHVPPGRSEPPDQHVPPDQPERSERPDQHVPPGRSEPPDQHVPPGRPERPDQRRAREMT